MRRSLFVCDDDNAHNQRPIGRVILPIAPLCTNHGDLLPSAAPFARRLVLKVQPVGHQHSQHLRARYSEARPPSPNSPLHPRMPSEHSVRSDARRAVCSSDARRAAL